jgi:hypothetical protein
VTTDRDQQTMYQVTPEFLGNVLRLVEYLQGDEFEGFEELKLNGEDTTGHIYLVVKSVAETLWPLGFQETPELKAYLKTFFGDGEAGTTASSSNFSNYLHRASDPDYGALDNA